MGFDNGSLYSYVVLNPGYNAPLACPGQSTQFSEQTFCFYQGSFQDPSTPETWTYLGSYSPPPPPPPINPNEIPIEIVFGPGACSGYTYVYTDNHRVLRASNGWNFTSLTNLPDLPNIPSNTTGKVASFAIADQGSQTRIFYGNYPSPNCQYTTTEWPGDPESLCPNFHPATCVAGSPANACPHAYVWHSDDCGDTWSTPFAFGEPEYHAQEVHAINVDPANPLNIYVTVDRENADTSLGGLWQSTDGGNTFTHVAGPPANGSPDITPVNFVFPAGSNQIFLESDGDSSLNVMPPNNSPGGPLVSWDKVNGGPFQVAVPWPSTQNCSPPPWEGLGLGIAVTSEQNIFTVTSPQANDQNCLPTADNVGVWYFAPPSYTNFRILENFPPGAPDSSIFVIGRTVEVTNPTTNFTYLYNGNTRFVKPEFTGAQQTLSNLNAGGGYFETFFIGTDGTDQHVHMLLFDINTGGWGNWDVSSSQSPTNILPAAGSALSTLWAGYPYDETFFIGTDQHVHMMLNDISEGGWGNWDINSLAQSPTNIAPVAGSALSSNSAGSGYYETFFIGTDLHVHMLLNNPSQGAWGNHDVTSYATGPSSVVPLVGSALSSVNQTNGNIEVFFVGMDQHLHMLLNAAGSWANYDLNSLATSPTAVTPANWTQLSALDLGSGNSEVFFIGTDLHVHRLLNMNGVWENDDVNSLAQAPTTITAMLGSSLQAFSFAANATATFFIGTDQHVHRLYFNGNGGWENDDLNALGQAPTNVLPAIRSPYTIIDLGGGNSETFFIGIDGHMHMFLNYAGAWGNWDISSSAQSPTNTLPATP